jgi:cytochrome P450
MAGYGTFVMLASATAIKDVFSGDPHVLHSGEGNEFLSITVGKNSVLVLDDEAHARQRRILLPPLKGERMRSFFDAIQQATLDILRTWPTDRPIIMDEPMRRITLRVMLRAVLGLNPGAQLDDLEYKVHRVLHFGRTRRSLILLKIVPHWLLRNRRWLPYYGHLRQLDEAIYAFIAACRRQPAGARGDNIVADLLAETHEDGRAISDEEIRDAIVTLLTAGHDTTSVALLWALEQIVPRADVVGTITDELQRVTGGGPPRADQLSKLDYLDAAIRESLRVRTILPFVVRLTKAPFVAGGREYPPGVLLSPCNHLVHHREDLYPDPNRFRPVRFLERRFAGHEWFPFGGGNRTCLGMAFALYEMRVVLATLFSQVRLARPAASVSHPVRLGISLSPHDGVRMQVLSRR